MTAERTVIERQFIASSGLMKIRLAPSLETTFAPADTATEALVLPTLAINRRYLMTLLLATTGTDGSEYTQLVHIVAATDGTTTTSKSFEAIRTILNGTIAVSGAFPFTLELVNTLLVVTLNITNNAGQAINGFAILQIEDYQQPSAPA